MGFAGRSSGKEMPAMLRTLVNYWNQGSLEKVWRLPIKVFLGFLDGSDVKESACNMGNLGSI